LLPLPSTATGDHDQRGVVLLAQPLLMSCYGVPKNPVFTTTIHPYRRLFLLRRFGFRANFGNGPLAHGCRRDEQVNILVGHVLVLRLREHCQHPCQGDGGSSVRALPLVPLEGGGNRLARMNDHDGRMATAQQDDAEGVLSRRAGTSGAIPRSSWHTHDGSTAATASIRGRFGLEAASAALAGNSGHSSDHRSKARKARDLRVRQAVRVPKRTNERQQIIELLKTMLAGPTCTVTASKLLRDVITGAEREVDVVRITMTTTMTCGFVRCTTRPAQQSQRWCVPSEP